MMQSQQLQSIGTALSLPLFLKRALTEAGYRTIGDLEGVNAAELASELRVGVPQAEDITRQVEAYKAGPSSQSQARLASQLHSAPTASEILAADSPVFTTGCASLDDLVSTFADQSDPKGKRKSGLSPGMVLEISGPPGSGKTSACVALAISARCSFSQVDELGTAVEVLVVDTEGGMSPTRISQAAESALRSSTASPRDALRGIHYMRVTTQAEMIAFWHTIDEWLVAHPNVKLLIVDTLTFHFRQPSLDPSVRRRLMELVRSKIGQASTVHGCAVVIANQLATKLLTSENKPANFDTGERAVLMPQLGELWTTAKTVRVVLFRGNRQDPTRYAHASMSAASKKDPPWARFTVDADGMLQDITTTEE